MEASQFTNHLGLLRSVKKFIVFQDSPNAILSIDVFRMRVFHSLLAYVAKGVYVKYEATDRVLCGVISFYSANLEKGQIDQ